jgi:ABC-2 type transport system ATP-binding protein
VREVLDIVGLSDVAGRRARGFSLGMHQRLGMAAALLGDPAVLVCDEPVNGLDPEGIKWMRNLLRGLAVEGRTVFVSSHLMSEMALMADHVIVVGRGRLLADASVDELTAHAAPDSVTVRTPSPERLLPALRGVGAEVETDDAGAMVVTGLAASEIGDLAAAQSVALHELTPRQASLEAAFLDLTRDSTQFHATGSRT